MTKDEAKRAMKEGKKVTHRFFSPDEWIIDTSLAYRFEDGYFCDYDEFWNYRTHESWNDGWSIFDDS